MPLNLNGSLNPSRRSWMVVDTRENLLAASMRWPSIICDQGQVVDICDTHMFWCLTSLSPCMHPPPIAMSSYPIAYFTLLDMGKQLKKPVFSPSPMIFRGSWIYYWASCDSLFTVLRDEQTMDVAGHYKTEHLRSTECSLQDSLPGKPSGDRCEGHP